MKKFLLFASAALVSASSAFASTEAADTYADVDGISVYNRWVCAKAYNVDDWAKYSFSKEYYQYARTATLFIDEANKDNNRVVVAWGPSRPTGELNADGTPASTNYGLLGIINFATGAWEKEVSLTCDGEPITGLLCNNQIATDDFGNIWFSNYHAGTNIDAPIKVYKVNDINTGECTLAAELYLPADESANLGRVDYIDVLGDVTGVESHAIAMGVAKNGLSVYRWRLEQGGTAQDWAGDFDGYVCWDTTSGLETYPADLTAWGGVATINIMYDDELTGESFYIDDFATCPVLYNTGAGVVDGFMNAPAELIPNVGCNGVSEFSIGDKSMIAYVKGQPNDSKNNGAHVIVAEIPDLMFENMVKYWELPEKGLGVDSDGGNRVHNIMTLNVTDANGVEGVYLLTYKCNNGMGLYVIHQEGFEDPYGEVGVEGIEADTFEGEASYYNLQGVKVVNPENGLYIVKRGNKVSKEMIVK